MSSDNAKQKRPTHGVGGGAVETIVPGAQDLSPEERVVGAVGAAVG
jgi:hypothetical protein